MNNQVLIKKLLFVLAWIVSVHGGIKAQGTLDSLNPIRQNRSLLSLVVSIDDSLYYAQSFHHHKIDELFNQQSLTKNIMALLIGIAIDKGYIDSIGVKISNYFPALKNDPDERKRQITLRDIMNQASGLWHEDLKQIKKYLRISNPSDYTLRQPMLTNPGSQLHYNNAASHLMSVILSKATHQTTFTFAQQYLFFPLGIKNVTWPKMNDGYNDGCGLLSVRMNTVDMNKLGKLILQEGKFEGRQILSKQWIAKLLRPEKQYPAPWELPNTNYGLTLYHGFYKNMPITYGMGWGGQFMMLIPDLQTVISVNQEVNDRTAIQQSSFFLSELFPAIADWILAKKKK